MCGHLGGGGWLLPPRGKGQVWLNGFPPQDNEARYSQLTARDSARVASYDDARCSVASNISEWADLGPSEKDKQARRSDHERQVP